MSEENKSRNDLNNVNYLTKTFGIDYATARKVIKEIPENHTITEKIGEGEISTIFRIQQNNIPFFQNENIQLPEYSLCLKIYTKEDQRNPLYFKNLPFNQKDDENNLVIDIRKISNPGMMKVTKIGDNSVISEYCGNKNLEDCIEDIHNETHIKDPLCTFLEYFWDLLFTVYKNKQDRISHNDIKTTNIQFHKNKFKIIDFDLVSKTGINISKENSSGIGTLFYSSPEQIIKGDVSDKNDVYSLGVILYEALHGKHHIFDIVENPKPDKLNFKHFLLFFENPTSFKIRNIGFGNQKAIEKLLRGMIKINPDYRLSIEDCIKIFYFSFGDYICIDKVEQKKEEFGIIEQEQKKVLEIIEGKDQKKEKAEEPKNLEQEKSGF
jgi:serine/threonine protein kinase